MLISICCVQHTGDLFFCIIILACYIYYNIVALLVASLLNNSVKLQNTPNLLVFLPLEERKWNLLANKLDEEKRMIQQNSFLLIHFPLNQ